MVYRLRRTMLTVQIKTDNADFVDNDLHTTVAHCVEEYVVKMLQRGFSAGVVKDGNGNTVGHFELTE